MQMPDRANAPTNRTPAAIAVLVVALTFATDAQQRRAPGGNTDAMAQISREYVRLVLAMGAHDKDYVDAYYGPADIKLEAETAKLSLDDIGKSVAGLSEWLKGVPAAGGDELSRLR